MAHTPSEANYRWHDVNLGRRNEDPLTPDHEMHPANFRFYDVVLGLVANHGMTPMALGLEDDPDPELDPED